MKKEHTSQSGFFNPRILFGFVLGSVLLALIGFGMYWVASASAAPPAPQVPQTAQTNSGIQVGHSIHNDISPALRDLPMLWPPPEPKGGQRREMREANLNPRVPLI